ncbi:MAG: sulfatase [Thermoanaerobaculia bacterium]
MAQIYCVSILRGSLALTLTTLAVACAERPPEPASQRLVDLADEATVTGAQPPAEAPEGAVWTFGDAEDHGWEAVSGVAGLRVEGGALVGRSTDDLPILHLAWQPDADPQEPVHAVEVRMASSAPGRLRAEFVGEEGFVTAQVTGRLRGFSRGFDSPVMAGDTATPYTLQSSWAQTAGGIRHLVLVPADSAGVDFRIESVRVVLRREHLAGIASGVGWQGLGEIYRETLVTRSPETWRFPLRLADAPLLDLAVGTVEDGAATFEVAVVDGDDRTPVTRRTVSRPHAWTPLMVDLERWAGRDIELELSLRADKGGVLGFWGSPAVRQRVARAKEDAAPQGVILVIADTLRRDHLSTYGAARETSPVLSRLAAEGTLFRDTLSQATWTKVSVPSILTSLHPTSHGVLDFSHRLPAAAETVAETYREAGYATLSLTSVPFVGRFNNLHQGFEELHEAGSARDTIDSKFEAKTAREYVDRLLPWLEAHRDVPFFILLHVFDPHDPFEPYAPYDALWSDPAFDATYEEQLAAARQHIVDPLMRQFGMPSRDEMLAAGIEPGPYLAHEMGWYDGSIRALDVEIGRLAERLEELGLAERTLLAFTSDHGEEFLEHGRHFHGQSVYGELNQVPLLLHGAGVPAGREVTETVRSIDVVPTLLDISGLAAPERAQGRSLVLLMTGATPPGRTPPAITEKHATADAAGPPPRDTAATAIVVDGWKLVHHTQRAAGDPEFELFDRRSDPLDAHDVAAEHPEIVERLHAALESWRASAEAARLPTDEAASEGHSAQELERLRALGYI